MKYASIKSYLSQTANSRLALWLTLVWLARSAPQGKGDKGKGAPPGMGVRSTFSTMATNT